MNTNIMPWSIAANFTMQGYFDWCPEEGVNMILNVEPNVTSAVQVFVTALTLKERKPLH